LYSHAGVLYSHARFFYSHAGVLCLHARFFFSHAGVLYSHARFFYSYAGVLYSHARFLYSHAGVLYSHARFFYSHAGMIDAVRESPLGELFRPANLVNKNAGAGNNWPWATSEGLSTNFSDPHYKRVEH
jgi:hypothetical protein